MAVGSPGPAVLPPYPRTVLPSYHLPAPRMRRRDFLSSLAGLAVVPLAGLATETLPTRRLGRTGLEVPILGLGGAHVGRAGSERAARELIELAFEEGIRFFDTAESYQSGGSERWIGAAIKDIRHHIVLMTKTFSLADRSADSARRHLEGSLRRLQTDYLDIWQLHSVRTVADVDHAFRPGGAMEFIMEAKAQGIVRHVGVTGHALPAANRRTIEYWDRGFRFDVTQIPLNPVDYHQLSFEREVVPALVERDIGVIAMKTSADRRLLSRNVCTIDECLRYVWSLPVGVAVVGMERSSWLRHNARLAREHANMSRAELTALRERVKPRARLDLEWYKGG